MKEVSELLTALIKAWFGLLIYTLGIGFFFVGGFGVIFGIILGLIGLVYILDKVDIT